MRLISPKPDRCHFLQWSTWTHDIALTPLTPYMPNILRMCWWVTAVFLAITGFYHYYLTTLSSIATKIGTALPYYPAAYRTATVMPNRSLFGIPISTSLSFCHLRHFSINQSALYFSLRKLHLLAWLVAGKELMRFSNLDFWYSNTQVSILDPLI